MKKQLNYINRLVTGTKSALHEICPQLRPMLLMQLFFLMGSFFMVNEAEAINITGSGNGSGDNNHYTFPVTNSSIILNATGNCGKTVLTIGVNKNANRIIWKREGIEVAVTNVAAPISTVAGGTEGHDASQLEFPLNVCVDSSANIYITDQYNHRVQKWAPGATAGITVAGGNGQGSAADQLNYPYGVAVDQQGNVYVSDAGNNRIQKWAPGATSGITVAGGNERGAAANQFAYPYGITITGNGTLYVADYYNHRIQQWLPGSKNGITVAGGHGRGHAADQLNYPTSVFADENGVITIADAGNDRIQRWMAGSKSGVTVAGGNGQGAKANQLDYPTDVRIDGKGNLYIADITNHRIQQWAPGATTGITVAGGNGQGSGINQLKYPNGLFIDAAGNLYIADQYNQRIQKWKGADVVDAYSFNADLPGNYTADIIDAKGQLLATTKTVAIYPKPSVDSIRGQKGICAGAHTLFTTKTIGGVWSSDDSTIAAVNQQGQVYGIRSGSATIHYRTGSNGCMDSVATGIVISSPSAAPVLNGINRLEEHTSNFLTADKPGGKWSSASEAIAAVNEQGLVTGVAPGVTTIVYTMDEVSGCRVTASMSFSILPPAPSVKDVEYDISQSDHLPISIRGQVIGYRGTLNFYQAADGPAMSELVPQLAPVAGKYTIWVSQLVNGVLSLRVPFRVTLVSAVSNVKAAPLPGVHDAFATGDGALKVTVMPNPTTTFFTIKMESKTEMPVNLRITDAYGRAVENRSNLQAGSSLQIGHQYISGNYFAEIVQGNQRKVIQLIKL